MSETKINVHFSNSAAKNTSRYGIKKGFKPPKFETPKNENNNRKGVVGSFDKQPIERIYPLPEIEPLNGE